jgi:UDP-N-acetylmuramate: L-alanyl-gamma-D-glutamyl-meso-diaminopimelate ligase
MTQSYRHIHLIAIGGTGMAALAGLLKSAGYQVTGSDSGPIYPPMSEVLVQQGIAYAQGYRPENVGRDADLVVIGNAVSKTNPEVEEVLRRGLPYRSFPQALAEFFLKDRVPIVIAGTHGKTTTSALMAWVLDQAGLDPGFLIGGWAVNFSGNSRRGTGKYFVVEGDEYDTAFFDKGPKFLHYRPQAAILTSLEFDHADIYTDLDHLKKAFAAFVRLVPKEGLLVAAHGDPHIKDATAGASCRIETYGLSDSASWRIKAPEFSGTGVVFRVAYEGDVLGEFQSPLPGRHNLENALAVIALASRLGIPIEKIRAALASFQGVRRRQEVIGTVNGVTVIDDFAHHPTAIRETLYALRLRYPGSRLWAIFEPRSATSRRRVFQEEFPKAFHGADRVIIADLFAPDKIPQDQRLDPRRVVRDLVADGVQALFGPTPEEIIKTMGPELQEGDVVCIMSSGGFGGLHEKLLSVLRERRSKS